MLELLTMVVQTLVGGVRGADVIAVWRGHAT